MERNCTSSINDSLRKKCRNPSCGKELYVTSEFFGKNARMEDGFDYYCKECRAADRRKRINEADGWGYVLDSIFYWAENLPMWSTYGLANEKYALNNEQVDLILGGASEAKVKRNGEFHLRRNRPSVLVSDPRPERDDAINY